MLVGVAKESFPGERRVAVVPDTLTALKRKNIDVIVERGAGAEAGITDELYAAKGATLADSKADVYAKADVILQVRSLGANPQAGAAEVDLLRSGQAVIGFAEPLTEFDALKTLAGKGVTSFSMELMPRITRAQSMDALSSMATVAGYKAVLMSTDYLPKFFPMFMTAAGTIAPARVFIIGAGVAGLQAIATAKRLGAVVKAYDVRPAVKEQVQSLGADFVEMQLETGDAEGKGGYAKEMDEAFYRKQREMMSEVLAETDVVVTTAAIPGKKAPILITEEMVKKMPPRSVLVDLAAERGGNCEVTKPGEVIEAHGVTVLGPLNLPTTIPYHASQMYSKNISTFLIHLAPEGQIKFDMEDEITRDTLLTKDGEIVNARVRELAGMSALPAPQAPPAEPPSQPTESGE